MDTVRMRKRIYLFLALCTLLLVGIAVNVADGDTPAPFHISVYGTEEISCWENGGGYWYVFLPGYAEPSDAKIVADTASEIRLDGILLSDGISCGEFSLNVPHTVEYSLFGKRQEAYITFLTSGEVPTLYIDTASGSMDYIHNDKENKENASVRLYLPDGTCNYRGSLSIKGRGNSTWTDHAKKPYGITLSEEASLLGMGMAQNWVLLANAADASHMRNKTVFDFSAAIGLPYSPDSQWVNLYLNGGYAGLYLLSERNEVHPERVDLGAEGSLLVSMEWPGRQQTEKRLIFIPTQKEALRVHYPRQIEEKEMAELRQRFQSLENALLSEEGIDPASGETLQSMIDGESWVLNYLVDEVFGNPDAFNASRFFYIPADGVRIKAGPVWDYDKALGNGSHGWGVPQPEALVANRYDGSLKMTMPWANGLYRNPWFYGELQSTFEEIMLPAVEELLSGPIDQYADLIRSSAQMDGVRWGYGERYPFAQEVQALKDYVREHTAFLEKLWLGGEEYCHIRVVREAGELFYSVPCGDTLEGVLERAGVGADEYKRWYYITTKESFDIRRPVTENMELAISGKPVAESQAGKPVVIRRLDDKVIKLIPLGVITLMGLALLTVEVRRLWKYR